MKESYVKGLANHDGPESCVACGDVRDEALTAVRAGWVLSREKGSVEGVASNVHSYSDHPAW